MKVPSRLNSLLVSMTLLTVLNNKYVITHVSIFVKRLSLLCVDVLQYFMYKILQNINTKQTQPFYRILTGVISWEVFFVCCSLSIILHLCLTVTGPVFSPAVHFKNECLNIHTYILFVSIFSYRNTPLCITLHTQDGTRMLLRLEKFG